jgi:nucleotide-binding universal stress UspA family protein
MLSMLIVPLDGSPLAERALPYAEALAQRAESRLVLTRAIDGDANDELDERQLAAQAEAESYLQTVAQGLASRGLTANIATPRGDVAEQIVAEGEDRSAGMIIMATHGRDGLARLFSGSVAEEVLHKTHRPVMFIRAGDDVPTATPFPPHSRILVPLDGSLFAEAALQLGHELAQLLEGELVLLRVVTPPPPPAMSELSFAAAPDVEFDREEARRESEEYLQRIGAQHGLDPARVRTSVQVGEAAEGIVEAIRASDASAVVMATHARSGFGRLLFGSTATETLHQITVPLVLLHTDEDPELAGSEQAEEVRPSGALAATVVNVA